MRHNVPTGTSANTAAAIATTDVTYNSTFFPGNPEQPCEYFGVEGELDFNDCGYVFHAGEYDGEGMATGTVDLVCANPGEELEIRTEVCRLFIPPQEGLGPITYSTIGEGMFSEGVSIDFDINPQMQEGQGITYSGEGLFCSGEFTNGSYDGTTTVTATEAGGEGQPIPLAIVEGS